MHKGLARTIGLYGLLTGGHGALWLVYSILLAGGGSLPALLILALCVLTAFAGMRLWNGQPGGVRLSIGAQAAQLLNFSIGGLHYLFTAGLAVRLQIGSGPRVTHAFGTAFDLGWASGFGTPARTHPFAIGVNLVPLVIILYLMLAAGPAGKKR